MRFVPAALLPLIIGWIAWPYFAVFSLMNAVQNGDIPTLERRVDWTSVRQALRGDLNAHLLQNLTGKKGDTSDAMGTGFAALLGPAVINNLIDGYVTPQAIAALARNEGKAGPSNDDKASSNNVKKAVSQVRRLHWEQVKYAFFSGNPLSFEVDLLPPNDPPLKAPINLVFNWSGDWRLVRIMLPSDVLDTSSRTVAKQDTPPKPQQGKIAEPPPVELTLLSKRFREANFRATPAIQTAIEFELSIINKTQQQIRAFDGVLTFTDLLDNELLQSKLAINDLIGAGSSVHWSGEINFNEFMDSHRRLRNADIQNVKIKFSPRKLLYANGSKKEFN